jgi:hypothetical protein
MSQLSQGQTPEYKAEVDILQGWLRAYTNLNRQLFVRHQRSLANAASYLHSTSWLTASMSRQESCLRFCNAF